MGSLRWDFSTSWGDGKSDGGTPGTELFQQPGFV